MAIDLLIVYLIINAAVFVVASIADDGTGFPGELTHYSHAAQVSGHSGRNHEGRIYADSCQMGDVWGNSNNHLIGLCFKGHQQQKKGLANPLFFIGNFPTYAGFP